MARKEVFGGHLYKYVCNYDVVYWMLFLLYVIVVNMDYMMYLSVKQGWWKFFFGISKRKGRLTKISKMVSWSRSGSNHRNESGPEY